MSINGSDLTPTGFADEIARTTRRALSEGCAPTTCVGILVGVAAGCAADKKIPLRDLLEAVEATYVQAQGDFHGS